MRRCDTRAGVQKNARREPNSWWGPVPRTKEIQRRIATAFRGRRRIESGHSQGLRHQIQSRRPQLPDVERFHVRGQKKGTTETDHTVSWEVKENRRRMASIHPYDSRRLRWLEGTRGACTQQFFRKIRLKAPILLEESHQLEHAGAYAHDESDSVNSVGLGQDQSAARRFK